MTADIRQIDPQNPVNWSHNLNRDKVFWALALPTTVGHSVFYDLTRHSDAAFQNLGFNDTAWAGSTGTRPGACAGKQVRFTSSHFDCAIAPEHTAFKLTTAFTICGWVRRRDAGTNQYVLAKRAGTPIFTLSYQLLWLSSGFGADSHKIQADVSHLGSFTTVRSTSAYNLTNEWHHLAVTFNSAGNIVLYLDGVSVGSGASPGTADDTSTDLTIAAGQVGATSASWEYGNGDYDDVCLYARELSPLEVLQVYHESLAGYPTALNWERPAFTGDTSPPPQDGVTSTVTFSGPGGGSGFEREPFTSDVLALSDSFATPDSFAMFSDAVMFAEVYSNQNTSPPAISDALSLTDSFATDPTVTDAVIFAEVVAGVPSFFNPDAFGSVPADKVSFESAFQSSSGELANGRYRR
jgi:hypothetical protein